MVSSQITCKCGKKSYWIVENKFTKDPCPNCGRVYVGKYNRKKLTIEAIEIRESKFLKYLKERIKFLKYLFEKKSTYHNWFEVLWCRYNNHPKGVIWFCPGGLEPDFTCKGCGDDLN